MPDCDPAGSSRGVWQERQELSNNTVTDAVRDSVRRAGERRPER